MLRPTDDETPSAGYLPEGASRHCASREVSLTPRSRLLVGTDGAERRQSDASRHSHSIVPGGFEVTSSTTRLTPSTSFVMRFEILASTS